MCKEKKGTCGNEEKNEKIRTNSRIRCKPQEVFYSPSFWEAVSSAARPAPAASLKLGRLAISCDRPCVLIGQKVLLTCSSTRSEQRIPTCAFHRRRASLRVPFTTLEPDWRGWRLAARKLAVAKLNGSFRCSRRGRATSAVILNRRRSCWKWKGKCWVSGPDFMIEFPIVELFLGWQRQTKDCIVLSLSLCLSLPFNVY